MIDIDEKAKEERNWKLYEASFSRINILNQRQEEQDKSLDKWIMTTAAGSFGVSFAFIDKIVDTKCAVFPGLLLGGWSCFLMILIIGFFGYMASSFAHSKLVEEENKALSLKYEGIEPEYKKRSIFFGINAVLGYIQILLFIGGSLCLILFVGKNLII